MFLIQPYNSRPSMKGILLFTLRDLQSELNTINFLLKTEGTFNLQHNGICYEALKLELNDKAKLYC